VVRRVREKRGAAERAVQRCAGAGTAAPLDAADSLLYLAATLLTGALSWLLISRPGYGLLIGAVFSIYVLYAQRYGVLNFLPTVVIVGSLSITSTRWTLAGGG
jgi:hypothetical protein